MQVRQQLLSFVIVGGGPTGVEVAAELHDMISEDLRKVYPSLMPFVSIKLIELQDHILSTYDRIISEYTHTEFDRFDWQHITLVPQPNHRLIGCISRACRDCVLTIG